MTKRINDYLIKKINQLIHIIMRKNIFVLLLSILAFQICLAAPRSYKQARAIALQKAAALGVVNPKASLSKQSPGGA